MTAKKHRERAEEIEEMERIIKRCTDAKRILLNDDLGKMRVHICIFGETANDLHMDYNASDYEGRLIINALEEAYDTLGDDATARLRSLLGVEEKPATFADAYVAGHLKYPPRPKFDGAPLEAMGNGADICAPEPFRFPDDVKIGDAFMQRDGKKRVVRSLETESYWMCLTDEDDLDPSCYLASGIPLATRKEDPRYHIIAPWKE